MAGPAPRASLIGRTAQACEGISLVCLAVIAFLILAQILLRNFAATAYAGIEELARLAHITLVFLLVPLLFRERQHVSVDLLSPRPGSGLARLLEGLAALMTALYAVCFLASEYQFMAKNGSVPSPGLGIPNLLFFAGAYLGMGLLLLTAAERLVETLRGAPRGGRP